MGPGGDMISADMNHWYTEKPYIKLNEHLDHHFSVGASPGNEQRGHSAHKTQCWTFHKKAYWVSILEHIYVEDEPK